MRIFSLELIIGAILGCVITFLFMTVPEMGEYVGGVIVAAGDFVTGLSKLDTAE